MSGRRSVLIQQCAFCNAVMDDSFRIVITDRGPRFLCGGCTEPLRTRFAVYANIETVRRPDVEPRPRKSADEHMRELAGYRADLLAASRAEKRRADAAADEKRKARAAQAAARRIRKESSGLSDAVYIDHTGQLDDEEKLARRDLRELLNANAPLTGHSYMRHYAS